MSSKTHRSNAAKYLMMLLLFTACCVFSEGCSKQGEDQTVNKSEKTTVETKQKVSPPEKQLQDDKVAKMTLHEIREKLDRFKSISDKDLKRLRNIEVKYPDDRAVTTTLSYAMLVAQDWEGLATLYMRMPGKDLKEQDKITMAQALLKTGRYQEAIEVIKPLADEMEDNLGLRILEAHAYSFLGKYKEAAEVLDTRWNEVIEKKATEALLIRALVYFYTGEESKAQNMLNDAFAMNSQSSELQIRLHNSMSRVLTSLGEIEEAKVHSEKASQLYDELTAEEHRQFRLSAQSKALNDAWEARNVEECERIIKNMLPDADRNLQASLYRYLSEVYQAVGRNKDAQEAAKKSMELAGNDE